MTRPESVEHKILKARVMEAFRRAGCTPVNQEVTGTGYRSDLQFRTPAGRMHAAEIQLSPLPEPTAIRRTHNALRDGLRSVVWLTTREREPWNSGVPCVGIERDPRATRAERMEEIPLRIVRGLYLPTQRDCTDPALCWRARIRGGRCHGTHLAFVPRRAKLGIDEFATDVVTERLVPVRMPYEPPKRGSVYVMSTPAGAIAAAAEVKEFYRWRRATRPTDRVAHRPQTVCSRPGAAGADPTWARLKASAHTVAKQRQKTVRIIADVRRFLDEERVPAAAIRPRELALVPTEEDRKALIAAGVPGERIEVDPVTVATWHDPRAGV